MAVIDERQLIRRPGVGAVKQCTDTQWLPIYSCVCVCVCVCDSSRAVVHKTVCSEADASLGVKPRNCVCVCLGERG